MQDAKIDQQISQNGRDKRQSTVKPANPVFGEMRQWTWPAARKFLNGISLQSDDFCWFFFFDFGFIKVTKGNVQNCVHLKANVIARRRLRNA